MVHDIFFTDSLKISYKTKLMFARLYLQIQIKIASTNSLDAISEHNSSSGIMDASPNCDTVPVGDSLLPRALQNQTSAEMGGHVGECVSNYINSLS